MPLLLVELKLQPSTSSGTEAFTKIAPPDAEKLREETKNEAMDDTLVKLHWDTTIGYCKGNMADTNANAPPATLTKALSCDEQDQRAKQLSNVELSSKMSRERLRATASGDISNATAPPLVVDTIDKHDCKASEA